MTATRRVRWECPNGLHPAVIGPSRPPRDSIVRYCLPCSQTAGRLVNRTAPALERERRQRAEQRQATAARRRERARGATLADRLVDVLDYDGTPTSADAHALLAQAWATRELRDWHHGRRPPDLTIRRGQRTTSRSRRERDGISGHAKHAGDAIVLTVRPGLGLEWLQAIVVHEATHAALPAGMVHSPAWRSAYLRTIRELYDVTVANRGATWKLDEAVAAAIRTR